MTKPRLILAVALAIGLFATAAHAQSSNFLSNYFTNFVVNAPPATNLQSTDLLPCIQGVGQGAGTGPKTHGCTVAQLLAGTGVASFNGRKGVISLLGSDLGGVSQFAAPTNQWLTGFSAAGAFSSAQPTFSNIAGTASPAQGGTGLVGGTSGGVLYFSSPFAIASSPTLVLNAPVIGGGLGGSPTSGTRSGNTTTFVTTTGTLTNGHCVQIDGNGNFIDATAACGGGGGGSGTVSAGTAGQNTYYAATGTTVAGNPNETISNGALTLGQAASVLGTLTLSGSTSGGVTIQPQAAAGAYNFNLPTSAGTSGQPLISAGGGASPQTYGTLQMAGGGTGLTTGTSGGIPFFSSPTTMGTSLALTANVPVLGGGNGVAPFSGARSGNTTTFATTTGTLTLGHCVDIDANGNFIDSGAGCGGGGSGGNITLAPGFTATPGTVNGSPLVVGVSTLYGQVVPVAYTGTHTVLNTEMAGLLLATGSSQVVFKLPQPGSTGFELGTSVCFEADGSGGMQISPLASTLVGMPLTAGNVVIAQNGFACAVSDGTTSWHLSGFTGAVASASGGSGAQIQAQPTYSYINFNPGPLTSLGATPGNFSKINISSAVDNMTADALNFTCSVNPTVAVLECGTSATCASPTTIGSATLTAAGTAVAASITAPGITAGDYVAWEITAGTCTALNLTASAEIHTNPGFCGPGQFVFTTPCNSAFTPIL